MDKLQLIAVSITRHLLDDYIDSVREELDAKSAEYEGPIPFPPFEVSAPLETLAESLAERDRDDLPVWLSEFDLATVENTALSPPEAELEIEGPISVYGRKLVIYNSAPIRAAMTVDRPDGIIADAKMETVNSHGKGRNVPAGYDPNQDNQPNPE
ncbi:hypothetical protein ACFQMA_01640 [Halosimplex aquaticum]|uniref:Uncharacterized protein n=1 Tax=Halosimplex aquaticum TaxID=3026162 RepID=A0ABD5XZH6_9EURY|nr:hypothetical protein [Halosimplex aquaticum]